MVQEWVVASGLARTSVAWSHRAVMYLLESFEAASLKRACTSCIGLEETVEILLLDI